MGFAAIRPSNFTNEPEQYILHEHLGSLGSKPGLSVYESLHVDIDNKHFRGADNK